MDFIHVIFFQHHITPALLTIIPAVVLLRKIIRAHATWFYACASVVLFVLTAVYLNWTATKSHPTSAWYWHTITQLTKGTVGFVLFTIVMFQGVIKPWNRVTQQLYAIRGELAILASIFSMIHLTIYGVTYLVRSGKKDWPYHVLFWSSLSLMMIALPLFITSFKRVRRSMRPRAWKKLHIVSYPFYFLLYANILLVFIRRLLVRSDRLRTDAEFALDTYLSLAIYGGLFITYTILRIRAWRRDLRVRQRRKERGDDTFGTTVTPVEQELSHAS